MRRRRTGIERITQELFNAAVLKNISVQYFVASKNRLVVLAAQMLGLPLKALFRSHDIFLFPGFPPSPFFSLARKRCILYVHDLFLLTRPNDMNFAGRYYLTPLFAYAIRRLKYFFVNSEETRRALSLRCRGDAEILLYRPQIRNVFGLSIGGRAERIHNPSILRVAAVGTVEPRKNYLAAANICASLARQKGICVELHIIGRPGWGGDWDNLAKRSQVVLHGAVSDSHAAKIIDAADMFICSSHDEGLGLPLLESQHGGLPTIAPDRGIFHETLGDSGIYINPNDPDSAAQIIMNACTGVTWRARSAAAATENLQRWNQLAAADEQRVLSFLRQMLFG
jgi:glycosyltransferase involved in cell wall biosynthesis